MPMVLLPCREALLTIPGQVYSWLYPFEEKSTSQTVQHHNIDENTPLCNEQNTTTVYTNDNANTDMTEDITVTKNIMQELDHVTIAELSIHVLTTILLVVFAFYAAIAVPGVTTVWSFVGSSVGMFVAFIIPAACYLKIREKKGWRRLNVLAWVILIFAIVGSISCTYQAIQT